MHKTRHDIPAKTRKKVVELLNARLVDAIDLSMQAKQAHWNVKGPNFIALHELFDKVAEHAEGHVDALAERITALGGTAVGTVRAVAARSTLKAYPEDIFTGPQHLAALADALAAAAKASRQAVTSRWPLPRMGACSVGAPTGTVNSGTMPLERPRTSAGPSQAGRSTPVPCPSRGCR
jgi:starvation-inducible DNA-binding protein